MSFQPNDRETQNVLTLAGPERYSYFIERAAAWEEIWSVADESGWVLMSDDRSSELVPAWPAEAYANHCCVGLWHDCIPKTIVLADFVEKWLPGMEVDSRAVAVFPLLDDRGIIVAPERLRADLFAACQAY